MLYLELLEEFNLELKSKKLKKGTIYNHKNTHAHFQQYILSNESLELSQLTIEEINFKQLRGFKLYLTNKFENAVTVNMHLARMRVFFNFLIDEELVYSHINPMARIKNIREQKKYIEVFNDDEIRQLIVANDKQTFYSVRDKTIIMILVETALRATETTEIKMKNINRNSILIENGKGGKDRVVPINQIMQKQIMKYKRYRKKYIDGHVREATCQSDFLFLNEYLTKLDRSNINKILNRTARKCINIRSEVRISPHTIRHYSAQKYLKNGVDTYSLSRILGHYDTSITEIYLREINDSDIIQLSLKHSPLSD